MWHTLCPRRPRASPTVTVFSGFDNDKNTMAELKPEHTVASVAPSIQHHKESGPFVLSLSLSLSLSCLVLSCLVSSRPVLSCLVLSCLVLSCLVLSCLVLSSLVKFCLDLSSLVLFLSSPCVWHVGECVSFASCFS